MELLVVLSLLLFCGTSFADLSAEYDSKATLDGDSKYTVYWTHNATSDMMYIAVEVKATGWVALAFTKEKSSNMKGYDTCLGSVAGGTKELKDYLTDGHGVPSLDSQNDCQLDEAMESGGTTTIKYHRKVDTGDSKDVVIEKGEIILVWAYKNTDDSLSRHNEKGFASVTMISASEAVKLRSFYWKLGVASLSIAVAFLFK